MIGFAFSTILWLSMILTFTASFGMMVQMAASNTILQTIVEDEMRARVMSFYTVDRAGNDPGRKLVVLGVGGRDRRSVYCGVGRWGVLARGHILHAEIAASCARPPGRCSNGPGFCRPWPPACKRQRNKRAKRREGSG